MLRALADTHAVLWYIYNDPRLSVTAKTFIEGIAQQGDEIGLSAITIAEMVYLVEKGKIPQDSLTRTQRELDLPNGLLRIISFDRLIAEAMQRVARVKVPDFPDRIIAATAAHLGIPLISKDAKIQASGVPTIW